MCFFFKQKTAYEMRISDWSSDVCSSDLAAVLCLAFDGVIVRQRVRFGHPGGRKHAIGFPAAGLLKIIDDATGSLFAELLVEFRGACRIGVTHNKQQGIIYPLGCGGRGAEIVFRLI